MNFPPGHWHRVRPNISEHFDKRLAFLHPHLDTFIILKVFYGTDVVPHLTKGIGPHSQPQQSFFLEHLEELLADFRGCHSFLCHICAQKQVWKIKNL